MKCAKLRSAGTRGAPWRHGTCGAASIRYLWSIDMTSLQSSFQKQFARLARYNHWMNERLYALAAQMSDEERASIQLAFFVAHLRGERIKTFVHPVVVACKPGELFLKAALQR